MALVHVPDRAQDRLVQYAGVLEIGAHELEGGGIVEAVADALVRHGGDVDVLFLGHGAVGVQLVLPILGAEGQKHGDVPEVVQVVVDGRDAQGAHGRDEEGGVEGAGHGQLPGQQIEVIEEPQQPHSELQQHSGDVGEELGRVVKVIVELRRGLVLLDEGVDLVVDLRRRVMGVQNGLDAGVGGVGRHLLFNHQGHFDILVPGVDLLPRDESVDGGALGDGPYIGGDDHVHDAEAFEPFLSLLPDVLFNLRDLHRVPEEVAGGIPRHHDIGGDHGHGREAPHPAAVLTIAPSFL